jgi:beta-barrel assembly-enhancing protease
MKKLLGLLLGISLSMMAQANVTLPEMGSSVGQVMPLAKEQEIGDQIMLQIQHAFEFVEDPMLNEYINHLGFKLVAATPDARGRHFKFFIIKDKSLNAFALPGGYIGINTGLIMAADSEDELAGVMAHEIAHVTQRHFARRIESNKKMTLPMIVGLLGAALVASKNPEAAIGALYTTQASIMQQTINHTRANEHEADRIGIATLASAGYNPLGIASFFEKIQNQRKFSGGSKMPEFLSTHPSSSNRIADARNRAYLMTNRSNRAHIDFEILKADVQSVQYDKNTGRIPAPAFKPENQSILDPYFVAITQIEKDPKAAFEVFSKLAKQYPHSLLVRRNLARSLCHLKDIEQCFKTYEALLELYPGNDAILREYGNTALAVERTEEAMALYRRSLDVHPDDIFLLYNMSEAGKKAGEQVIYHEFFGRYLVQVGNYHQAITQFKMAQKLTLDQLTTLRLQSRISAAQKMILDRHYDSNKRR